MPIEMRQPFNPRGEFVARRSFVCNGHKFTTGDNFPWKSLSVDSRKLQRLFETGFILMKGDVETPGIPEIKVSGGTESSEPLLTPDDIEAMEEVDNSQLDELKSDSEEVDEDHDEEGLIFDPTKHTLDHPENDKWLILHAGEAIAEISRKEYKRLGKKTMPTKVKLDN